MRITFLIHAFLFSLLLHAQSLKKESDPKELTFSFKGEHYDAVIVNPLKEKIQMHWLSEDNIPYKSIKALKKELEKHGKNIIMITNGGMYLKGNIPQGLFIYKAEELRPIDSASNKTGNFYLKPNGVFYIDNTGAHVVNTDDFVYIYSNKETRSNISYATQSGPMLVINGKINPQFNPSSSNLHLRSGVGVLPDKTVIFIISCSNKTTFYDFATIFLEKFGCKNALYLDGAISKMFLPELRNKDLDGNFGVIISVTK